MLAVCSKNDPEVALEPFRAHPEMVLKEDDIAAFVASWGPKSDGIRSIAETLDLGLDSLTFLDDNPYERAEVRRALPEVDVPILPDEPTGFRRALEEYPVFRAGGLHQRRPRARAAVPRAGAGARAARRRRLARRVPGEPRDAAPTSARSTAVNLARVVQLINKTNQFNLTTRRRNQAELEAFLAGRGARASGCASPTASPTTG